MTRQQVKEMIQKHDVTGDGMLNFEEFRAIFFKDQEIEDDLTQNSEQTTV